MTKPEIRKKQVDPYRQVRQVQPVGGSRTGPEGHRNMGENDSGDRQRPQFVELPDPRRRLIMGSPRLPGSSYHPHSQHLDAPRDDNF